MTEGRTIIATTLEWDGIELSIIYEPNWLNTQASLDDLAHAHLEVRSIRPERAPLPITETGYRSHFVDTQEIDEAGGPAAYVATWLSQAAKTAEWRDYEARSRQLTLF